MVNVNFTDKLKKKNLLVVFQRVRRTQLEVKKMPISNGE